MRADLLTKDNLEDLYSKYYFSMDKISRVIQIKREELTKYFKKFNIKRRDRKIIFTNLKYSKQELLKLTNEKVFDLYQNKKISEYYIGILFNKSTSIIRKILIDLKLKGKRINPRIKLTEIEIEKIRYLRNIEKRSLESIANYFNFKFSKTYLRDNHKEFGILKKINNKKKTITKEDKEIIKNLHINQKRNAGQITRILNYKYSNERIRNYLKQIGVYFGEEYYRNIPLKTN